VAQRNEADGLSVRRADHGNGNRIIATAPIVQFCEHISPARLYVILNAEVPSQAVVPAKQFRQVSRLLLANRLKTDVLARKVLRFSSEHESRR
jgi:hypothetical protein